MMTTLSSVLLEPLPLPLPELVGRQWVGDAALPPVKDVLSDRELALWHRFPAHSPRRQEWFLGRLAAKEAVAHVLAADSSRFPSFPEIEILSTALGKPTVFCASLPNQRLPEVSISHSHGHVVAVAAPPAEPIGVDVERCGRVQVADIGAIAFTPNDLAHLPDSATEHHYLALWAAKEAAAKAAGTGLLGQPATWQVETYQPIADEWGSYISIRHQHQVFPILVWTQPDAVIALCHNRIAQLSFSRSA